MSASAILWTSCYCRNSNIFVRPSPQSGWRIHGIRIYFCKEQCKSFVIAEAQIRLCLHVFLFRASMNWISGSLLYGKHAVTTPTPWAVIIQASTKLTDGAAATKRRKQVLQMFSPWPYIRISEEVCAPMLRKIHIWFTVIHTDFLNSWFKQIRLLTIFPHNHRSPTFEEKKKKWNGVNPATIQTIRQNQRQ